MTKFIALALLLSATGPVLAQTAPAAVVTPIVATRGKMLLAAGGSRLAPITRIASDGSPQIIIEGKMVTVPLSTIAMIDGKLTTSLTKREITSHQ